MAVREFSCGLDAGQTLWRLSVFVMWSWNQALSLESCSHNESLPVSKKMWCISSPYFLCTLFLGGSIHGVRTAGSQVLREGKLVCGVCWCSAGRGEPVRCAEWHSAPSAWARCPVQRGLRDPPTLWTLESAAIGRYFKEGIPSVCIPWPV